MAQRTREDDASENPSEAESQQTVAVYQLPFTGEETVRDLRFEISSEERVPTESEFSEHYTKVGEQTVDLAEGVGQALQQVWHGWNRGSGCETRAFLRSETRSLAIGDIAVVDGTVYLCATFGWDETEIDPDAIKT